MGCCEEFEGTVIELKEDWIYINPYQEQFALFLHYTFIGNAYKKVPDVVIKEDVHLDISKSQVCMDENGRTFIFVSKKEKGEILYLVDSEGKTSGPFDITLDKEFDSDNYACYWSPTRKKMLLYNSGSFYALDESSYEWKSTVSFTFTDHNQLLSSTIDLSTGLIYYATSHSNNAISVQSVDPFDSEGTKLNLTIYGCSNSGSNYLLMEATWNSTTKLSSVNIRCWKDSSSPMVAILYPKTGKNDVYEWVSSKWDILFFPKNGFGAYYKNGHYINGNYYFNVVTQNEGRFPFVWGDETPYFFSHYERPSPKNNNKLKEEKTTNPLQKLNSNDIIRTGKLTGKEDYSYVVVAQRTMIVEPWYIKSFYIQVKIHGANYGKSDYTEILYPSLGRDKYIEPTFTDKNLNNPERKYSVLVQSEGGYEATYYIYEFEINDSGQLDFISNVSVNTMWTMEASFQCKKRLFGLTHAHMIEIDPNTGKVIDKQKAGIGWGRVNSMIQDYEDENSCLAITISDPICDTNCMFAYDLKNISIPQVEYCTGDVYPGLLKGDGISPKMVFDSNNPKDGLYIFECNTKNFTDSQYKKIDVTFTDEYFLVFDNMVVQYSNNYLIGSEISDDGSFKNVWKSEEEFEEEWFISTDKYALTPTNTVVIPVAKK